LPSAEKLSSRSCFSSIGSSAARPSGVSRRVHIRSTISAAPLQNRRAPGAPSPLLRAMHGMRALASSCAAEAL
jgi:hypothetical protein